MVGYGAGTEGEAGGKVGGSCGIMPSYSRFTLLSTMSSSFFRNSMTASIYFTIAVGLVPSITCSICFTVLIKSPSSFFKSSPVCLGIAGTSAIGGGYEASDAGNGKAGIICGIESTLESDSL